MIKTSGCWNKSMFHLSSGNNTHIWHVVICIWLGSMSPPAKTNYPYSKGVKIPKIFEIIIKFWMQNPLSSLSSLLQSCRAKTFEEAVHFCFWYPVISVSFRIQQSKSPSSKVARTTANFCSIHRWLQTVLWVLFLKNVSKASPRHRNKDSKTKQKLKQENFTQEKLR